MFRNGTGCGGTEEELQQKKCDYEETVGGMLYFQHGETSKQLIIRVNPDCKVMDDGRKVVTVDRTIFNRVGQVIQDCSGFALFSL